MSATLTPERPTLDSPGSVRVRAVLVLALIVGALIDMSFRTPLDGFALFGAVACLVLGLIGFGSGRSRSAHVVIVSALLPAAFLFMRTSPWVVSFDAIAAVVLVLLGCSMASSGQLFDADFTRIGRRLTSTAVRVARAPTRVIGAVGRRIPTMETQRRHRYAAIARGLTLALPLVLLLGLLLASADGVFASLFDLSFDLSVVPGHVIVILLAAWLAAGVLLQPTTSAISDRPHPRVTIGPVEGAVVLGGLIAVYALFAWARLLVAMRGNDYVIETTGLTYAEYARSGFFQLLWAAGITLLVLLGLRAVVVLPTSRSRRSFAFLSLLAVALTLVLVHAAVVRLDLYDQAFGLTMLRLYSTTFAWWIGAVFLLTGVALAGVARQRNWLAGAVLCSALVTLLLVNMTNPEQLVVRHNAERAAAGEEFDVTHALSLSDDARPALVDALPKLSRADREVVLRTICAPEARARATSWNLSSRDAVNATVDICRSE